MSTLYIVATPIGNLKDITLRALEILHQVDLVAAEDTRVAKKLFNANGVSTDLISYHQHNANQRDPQIVAALKEGKQVALISDAGTPLISDPGHSIVTSCLEHGFKVVPIPGASALVTALSVNSFNISRFCFEGFLPAKRAARVSKLNELSTSPYATVVYEAKHRIEDLLKDVSTVYGVDRQIIIARELTKMHEQIVSGNIQSVHEQFQNGTIPCKGEFVVILQGDDGSAKKQQEIANIKLLFSKVCNSLTHKDALELALSFSSLPKNTLYDLASEYYQNDK